MPASLHPRQPRALGRGRPVHLLRHLLSSPAFPSWSPACWTPRPPRSRPTSTRPPASAPRPRPCWPRSAPRRPRPKPRPGDAGRRQGRRPPHGGRGQGQAGRDAWPAARPWPSAGSPSAEAQAAAEVKAAAADLAAQAAEQILAAASGRPEDRPAARRGHRPDRHAPQLVGASGSMQEETAPPVRRRGRFSFSSSLVARTRVSRRSLLGCARPAVDVAQHEAEDGVADDHPAPGCRSPPASKNSPRSRDRRR